MAALDAACHLPPNPRVRIINRTIMIDIDRWLVWAVVVCGRHRDQLSSVLSYGRDYVHQHISVHLASPRHLEVIQHAR